jgi:hypothetical protein
MVRRYGEPLSMEDFCNKMQLMNAIGYQGIFEAAGHKLNDIGGVMLWKLNAAFPSVVWQVYDWYLQTNAGYYFMQNACEPLHIQLNLSNYKVTVLNRKYKSAPDLTASVQAFDTDSKSIFKEEAYFSLGPTQVKETTSVESILKNSAGVAFVVLNLKNSAGKVVSHNVYWLSQDNNYKSLNSMAPASLTARVVKSKNESKWSLNVTNTSEKIAFFIRPRLMSDDEEILPSFCTGSYFTLAPGESTVVSVSCPDIAVKGKKPVIRMGGWNVNEMEVIPVR